MSETLSDCDECGATNTMKKLVSTPYIKKDIEVEEKKVGDATKEHIEANREILEQQKQEIAKETYEPS
tara:strand:+ start:683 stop:886 length:204 start_codon:yes stop_codon:yes gene_type:complete